LDGRNVEGGVAAAEAAKAHEADLATQGRHGVDYRQYRVDEKAGTIFSLVAAPSAEAANALHREAHGLVTNEMFEVSEH
jgi:hypothetical protein